MRSPRCERRGSRRRPSTWQGRASTTDGLSAIVAAGILRGISVEESLSYPARLAAVTPADVRRVAQRWFGESSLRVVAMGNPMWLEDLPKLGLGPYQRRNERAELVPLR